LKAGGRFIGVDEKPDTKISQAEVGGTDSLSSSVSTGRLTNENWRQIFEKAGFVDFQWTSLSVAASDEILAQGSCYSSNDMCFSANKPFE
jgi:hypothetical protein